MSEEEKKAIEKIKWYFEESPTLDITKNVNIVLNLIEKQDKMIDYMAGRITELIEKVYDGKYNKKDVIDIFKNLAVNNLLKEEKV